MAKHQFGGRWTEIKLDAVCYYLECYTKALSRRNFDLWYIDAFAGAGERSEEQLSGGLLEGKALEWVTKTLPGSALRALAIEPPFQHFIFNDKNEEHQRALNAIKAARRGVDIEVLGDDGNAAIAEIFSRQIWRRGSSGGARAVVFLDPYALQVNWTTLELLAKTECVDVWYLFPIRDVTRQLAKKISGIGAKGRRLDLVLSPAWRDLYSLPPPQNDDVPLLSSILKVADEERRAATQKQIEEWFRGRLNSIFAYASEPLRILTGKTRQAFSLFLAIANPSAPAINLAKHFHSHVLKNFAPEQASHRKSAR